MKTEKAVSYWIHCPICNGKTHTKAHKDTLLEQFLEILAALPEIQSRRIRAHIILDMTLSEIALQEEVSIATVQRAIQRGIKKIQKILTPDG